MNKPPRESSRPPEESRPKPAVTAFAVVRREKAWHALAIRLRGREVVDEKVLESTDALEVAEDVAFRACLDWTRSDIDPFKEVPR